MKEKSKNTQVKKVKSTHANQVKNYYYFQLIREAGRTSEQDPNNSLVKAIENLVLVLDDPQLNVWFVTYVKGANFKAHEQVVIDSKNLEFNYDFAKEKGADVKAHGRVVIESKDPQWNYNFAKYVEGADVRAHEKVVIDSKDPCYNCWFASDVKGADVEALEKVVIDSKDLFWNAEFLRLVEGADIEAHKKLFDEYESQKNGKEKE